MTDPTATTMGIAMVKDEVDIIAATLTHMADEVDCLVVADNGSTDGTRELLTDLARVLPLTVIDDAEVGYYQSARMSRLAQVAADLGGQWIVPFDADEIWLARGGRLRDVLPGLDYPVATARLLNHLRTALDVEDPNPVVSMVWRQKLPAALPKVAFRWEAGAVIHQGNHGVSLPGGEPGGLAVLEVRHFPVRSAEHLIGKARNGAAAYAATDLPEDLGRHWRAWGQLLATRGEDALREAFHAHWWYLSPVDGGLEWDPAPYLRWQVGSR